MEIIRKVKLSVFKYPGWYGRYVLVIETRTMEETTFKEVTVSEKRAGFLKGYLNTLPTPRIDSLPRFKMGEQLDFTTHFKINSP